MHGSPEGASDNYFISDAPFSDFCHFIFVTFISCVKQSGKIIFMRNFLSLDDTHGKKKENSENGTKKKVPLAPQGVKKKCFQQEMNAKFLFLYYSFWPQEATSVHYGDLGNCRHRGG